MASRIPEIIVCHGISDVAEKAAQTFVGIASHFLAKKDRFNIALSGGSTPEPLYRLLSSERFNSRIDWSRVNLFWGDERCVPPTDDASNYLMATRSLISRINIPFKNIHRIKGELGDDAADEYETSLVSYFALDKGGFPHFDLILLGMGEDGHTASIFPETPAVNATGKIVTAVHVEKLESTRITLTPPTINSASNIIVLVSGEDKADTVSRVLEGDYEPDELPLQILRRAKGNVLFFLDEAAASKLSPHTLSSGT